jgi:flagellar hook assembly protein FlgD
VALQDYDSLPAYNVPGTLNVTVGPSGTDDEVMPAIEMTAYPNPFRDRVALQVKSEEPGPAVISIYNTKGQLIRREELNLHAGELTYEWDGTDNLSRTAPRGLYIFKLSTASSSKTIKSIKLQ